MSERLLRLLPSIERLLSRPSITPVSAELTRDRMRDLLRDVTGQVRENIEADAWPPDSSPLRILDLDSVVDREVLAEELTLEIERRFRREAGELIKPSLRRVVNATGVIIHTNLGRAPLAAGAAAAVAEMAAGYSNLEYDLASGRRGHRELHCQELLARLIGAEAAVVVNNCAAAVLLVLNTLAEGGEVIVSRGELIEIGGSFRIPDVMAKSGAILREVGTTNRTRIGDYERAISEKTRLILRVHPSNYRIVGFTERPSVAEIADLARRSGIPAYEDLGSGCLIDLTPFGVTDEPVAGDSLRAGMSVITFSGDKMLGGPQAGVIAGGRNIVDRVRSNPLMRALRVDKMTYAALEATLRLYEQGVAEISVPVIRAMAVTREDIEARAADFARGVDLATDGLFATSLQEGQSVIGGGSAPDVRLPTVLVGIRSDLRSAAWIEERLRHYSPPVIIRAERGLALIDLRTVSVGEEPTIIDALKSAADELRVASDQVKSAPAHT